MTYHDAVARKYEARCSEADAEIDSLQVEAAAHDDREEVTALFELRVTSEKVRRLLADLPNAEPAQRDEIRRSALGALHQLEAAIARVRARNRILGGSYEPHDLRTRLDQAEAKLRLWKARESEEAADLDLRRSELLFALQERTALHNAHDAEQKYDRYNRLAQEALEEAARHFNEAFDAAARRHQLRTAEHE